MNDISFSPSHQIVHNSLERQVRKANTKSIKTIDESVPHQYQYLNQYKLKLICGCLEITRDNLTSTSVKVVPLIVTSIVYKVSPRNIAVWLRYTLKTARKLLETARNCWKNAIAVFACSAAKPQYFLVKLCKQYS